MALEEKPPRNYFVDKMCAVAGGAAGKGFLNVMAAAVADEWQIQDTCPGC